LYLDAKICVFAFPLLYTGDGMLINYGYRGTQTVVCADDATTARVALYAVNRVA
jgi:hypothetical protein